MQMHDAGLHRSAREHRADDVGEAREPPTTAIRRSCRPRVRSSFITLSQNLAPSICSIHSPSTSLSPSEVKEAMTKPGRLDALSESTGLLRKDVASVLDEVGVVIERHIKRRAVGTFTLPGLLKIKAVRKPATKARKMISPFTGQEITVAANPASRAVKVQPLSGLKRMVE